MQSERVCGWNWVVGWSARWRVCCEHFAEHVRARVGEGGGRISAFDVVSHVDVSARAIARSQ
eukprot:2221913-Rhodomonas_salina.2